MEKKKRGRPAGSQIRQNVVELLAHLKRGYGYQIHKIYCELFPEVTREVIYYHLRKGVDLKIFYLEEIKTEHGEYSWGKTVEKMYYTLGSHAHPLGDKHVSDYFTKRKQA